MKSEHLMIAGDGQMAVALAVMLADRGTTVTLWSPFPQDAQALQSTRESPRLAGAPLPPSTVVTSDPARAFKDATIAVNAIPTQFIRPVWERLRPYLPAGVPVVSVAKGIEEVTLQRPTEVLSSCTGGAPTCVLSGPTIAAELARRLPATMVSASVDPDVAARTQAAFSLPYLRVYTNSDVIGVEIAGAAKNVVAIAAGLIDGLGLGSNAKSALLARGLAEIARLGAVLGARPETFFGIAGVGDLATTCFSPEGRNRSCGEAIGRGEPLEQYMARTKSVVEGVATAHSIVALAARHQVDMPIVSAVEAILFRGLKPGDAIRELMGRSAGEERIG
jgi:glycerol-3-phosphate dehydrogenase (NAD(P)+)